MPKGIFKKIVKGERRKIFELLTDYENFQKVLPQHYPSIRIVSVRGSVSVVEEHLKIGDSELVMMVKHVINEPLLHELFVIGGAAKGTHITTKFDSIPNGTELTVEIDWKSKGFMKLPFFNNNRMIEDYSEIVDKLVKIAES